MDTDSAPHRDVNGRTIMSSRMPAVRIDVTDDFMFLGHLQFVLYGVAHVESFVFANAHDHRAGRLLVMQFEGFLEDNTRVYDCAFAQTVTLGDRPFHTDTSIVDLMPPPPPDSDMGRVLGLVEAAGYTVPERAAVQRFVFLPDLVKRNELLILYAEGLGDDGSLAVSWEEARERALGSFTVHFLNGGEASSTEHGARPTAEQAPR